MTQITLIILSTDFTDYTDFASRYALAGLRMRTFFNTNDHELPVNFRKYFLAELLLHAEH